MNLEAGWRSFGVKHLLDADNHIHSAVISLLDRGRLILKAPIPAFSFRAFQLPDYFFTHKNSLLTESRRGEFQIDRRQFQAQS
jgi:hypothetical protein